jgi:two-component system, chemotaxis family, CheB/CheR fusion protein
MTESASSRRPRHVVGIGASAGGLDALERFFDHVPRDTGMAFVIVQHLSPDFKSLMDELLARHTALPIHLVEDGMEVEADHVYLIPSKKEMIVSGGRLLLSERDRQQELSLPIDMFLRSLAQDCGQRAVAVVLSGGGSDGSRGVCDVAAAGGLVVVQDTDSAQFDGMPRSARDTGVAHWVLAPQDMPRVILEHATRKLAGDGHGAPAHQPDGLEVVFRMLLEEFGIDFTHYKPSTVTRRIERRLALARSNDIEEYVRRLKSERRELDILYQDLLIGVTRFFRDEQAFKILEERILPGLLEREPRNTPIRLWVAGCATGEEPYTLAILIQDLMARLGERPVKIFATDVHRGSLEAATRAVYGEEAVANVDSERLARYFIRTGDTYQVVPELRQMIVFAQHNVIKDAPFTRVDLISCRNLLIYLKPAAQQRVLSLFHFALNRDAALLLGPSESAGPLARAFESVDKHWRIYRKLTDARIAVDARMQPLARSPGRLGPAVLANSGRLSLAQLLGTYEGLLSEVMPPSLLVNVRGELIHAFGGASRFLRIRDGRQGLEVFELIDPELKIVLAPAFKRALNEAAAPIVYKRIRIAEGVGEPGSYELTVRKVEGKTPDAACVLFSFAAQGEPRATPSASATEVVVNQAQTEQLKALQAELNHTKENLQAAIEELEASNEELQASNEELQASNEELQSTNEELQSVNEELYTVNAEYQRKIAELVELTNDMDNLLSSTEVGTVFLDKQLNIRKFTPQLAETFSLVPHDVGRSIETFAHKMEYPELVGDLKQVLTAGQPVERELRGIKGRAFFLRVLPYRVKGSVEGVVLTLIDVSGLKAAEDALFHERYLLNSLLVSVPDAIYFKDGRGRFIRANGAMAARLALESPEQAVGKTVWELPDQDTAMQFHKEDDGVLRSGQAQHYKLERRERAGAEAWDLVSRLPLRDQGNSIVGVIAIFRDVTEQKRAETKIQEAVRRRDQFLAMLSHELRNPLGAMVMATALLKSDSTSARNRDKFLAILDRQSQQMSALLDDLLEASRVTQNKIELKKRVVDLNAVVKDAADAVRAQMEARGIAFDVETAREPLCVEGDAARLQQILVNLLNNAGKYTSNGGRVRLIARPEGDDAVIRVSDDGAGIAPEMLDSVFDLFVQSSRTLDRSAGGLGVGLTLVRSLVSMHGGSVTAHSAGEGKGSEFEVRLPLAQQALGEAPASKRLLRPIFREQPRILVVEDNPDGREMLCDLLVGAGFECRSADSGAAALRLIAAASPDLAILDVGLPGMDGLEVARRVRSDPEHSGMYLIALTGYGQASDRATALAAGFDEHLVKPVRGDDLLGLLASMRASPAVTVRNE